MTETKITKYTAAIKDCQETNFPSLELGVGIRKKKKVVFPKCRPVQEILPSNRNISEEEDLKMKVDKEVEKKRCK